MATLIGRNTFVAVTAVTVTEGKKTALAGGKKSTYPLFECSNLIVD